MTTNTYQSIINVDDATSFDRTFWLTEARGLSLRLLDAEEDVDKSEEDARAILERVMETRLAEIEEKGKQAKEAVIRRADLERRAATWTYLPDWYVEKYLEDNLEITMSHYHYMQHLYKQTKEDFTKWVDETTPTLAAEIYEQRFETLLAVEKAELDHEYEENNPMEVLDKRNSLHWEGAKKAGQERLFKIKRTKELGLMDELKAQCMLRHTEELYGNKQLCKREYLECCMILNKQLGYMAKYRELKAELENCTRRAANKSEFKMMPHEANFYDMDIEAGLDMKHEAEHIASRHDISVFDALLSIVERNI